MMNKIDVLGKNFNRLLEKKLYLMDMDGTIYLENRLFDGVKQFFQNIKEKGGKYVFITNNSSKSVNDYVKKLQSMGLDVNVDNFFTSTQAAIALVKEQFGNKLIYVQGTRSFISELKNAGVNLTEEYNESVCAVLVGFDPELTGEKLRITCKTLTNVKVPYYATNPDWVCPVDFGYVPDCGSMCFGIEKATGRAPEYIGKPKPTMILSAMQKFNCRKQDTVVFGDRIYTDIASGFNAGVDTVLVLSGEATMEDYKKSEIKPTFVLNSIKDML